MARRRRAGKRTAEVGSVVGIALGIGTVVAGVAIYEWLKKPSTVTAGPPAQLTPSGSGVQAAVAP